MPFEDGFFRSLCLHCRIQVKDNCDECYYCPEEEIFALPCGSQERVIAGLHIEENEEEGMGASSDESMAALFIDEEVFSSSDESMSFVGSIDSIYEADDEGEEI